MRRRDLLALSGGAAMLLPINGRAQPVKGPVVGYLSGRSPSDAPALLEAFYRGIGETGYVAGQNLTVVFRWAEGHYERFPEFAADLVGQKVDLIVAAGGATATRAAKAATSEIPIVFFSGGDPVQDGLVANLARPGGNLTGVSLQLVELAPKRLELLTELAPRARTITLLINPNNANAERLVSAAEAAARARGVQLTTLRAGSPDEIDVAFAKLAGLRGDAVVVGDDPFFSQRREQFVVLTARDAVPAIYPQREFVAAGGLASYAPGFAAAQRLLGIYCGRVLKGARPADLPVQQPTTLELVINLKTAKALGLTIPETILVQADEVIE